MVRLEEQWLNRRALRDAGFAVAERTLLPLLERTRQSIELCSATMDLLTLEARLTKELFRIAANAVKFGEFTRAKRASGADPANRFLDHGNYLAYGLGATATWVLGLPHGFLTSIKQEYYSIFSISETCVQASTDWGFVDVLKYHAARRAQCPSVIAFKGRPP